MLPIGRQLEQIAVQSESFRGPMIKYSLMKLLLSLFFRAKSVAPFPDRSEWSRRTRLLSTSGDRLGNLLREGLFAVCLVQLHSRPRLLHHLKYSLVKCASVMSNCFRPLSGHKICSEMREHKAHLAPERSHPRAFRAGLPPTVRLTGRNPSRRL